MRAPLIAEFMPVWALHEVDHVTVSAAPDAAWRTVRSFNLARIPFARALFEARILPERIAAAIRRAPQPTVATVGPETIGREPGFMRLGEEPGREFVAGAVGRFWKPHIEWATMSPQTFRVFAEPGWGKVAWSLRVDPRAPSGSFVTVDVRVGATDTASFDRFRPYWAMIGPFSRAIRHGALRALEEELGPVKRQPVAGDDLLASAGYERTHTQFIETTPSRLWPWLVQMGCRRAGWYSWDALDNGRVPSAETIVPELQALAEGDILPATPRGDGGFAVLRIEPQRALVLGAPRLLRSAPPPTDAPAYDSTWAFQLEPVGPAATLLTVRVRAAFERTLRTALIRATVPALHEIMQRRQLRNLKIRAERQ